MSSTIEMIEFRPEHIHGLTCPIMGGDINRVLLQARHGKAWTMVLDGRIAGSAGVCKIWPGMGEAWMLPNDIAKSKPVYLVKSAHRFVDYMMQSLLLHRLQGFCRTADRSACRYAEVAGLHFEGVCRKYGPDGSDYSLYALVR